MNKLRSDIVELERQLKMWKDSEAELMEEKAITTHENEALKVKVSELTAALQQAEYAHNSIVKQLNEEIDELKGTLENQDDEIQVLNNELYALTV